MKSVEKRGGTGMKRKAFWVGGRWCVLVFRMVNNVVWDTVHHIPTTNDHEGYDIKTTVPPTRTINIPAAIVM